MTAYERADARMRKTTYKGLSDSERRYIKAVEAQRQFDKELSRFYRTAPRTVSGAVDWENMDEKTLDYFDHIYKGNEKALAKISKMEAAGIDGDRVKSIFLQLNTHSVCF